MSATMTALVVVRDPVVQADLVVALRGRNVRIDTAETVQAIDGAFANNSYRLAYTDAPHDQLGSDVLRTRIHATPRITRWIVLGPPEAALLRLALHSGVADYLSLPLHSADLDYGLQIEREQLQADADLVAQVQQQSLALMSRLAANLAHEINNPLTPILGLAEFLHDEAPPNSPTYDAAAIIINSALRIANTVRNLMGFTRPLGLRHSIDLRILVNEAVRLVETHLREQYIVYQLQLPPKPVLLAASSAELKQAIFLLLEHARMTMPTGGRLEIVLTLLEATAAPHARLEVRDTAPAIATHQLPQLFEPFYSTSGLGIGLGFELAIVRRIIEQHGGSVGADAGSERGNNLWFYLPITE